MIGTPMADPLGLIGNLGSVDRSAPLMRRAIGTGDELQPGAPDFKQMLQQQIDQVNQLQSDANQAVEDLAIGDRNDVESVIIATQKADIAFKMLLQVRNKVMDAYEEVKQLRV
jgi:flagellar hook-basal body complex protein FliE